MEKALNACSCFFMMRPNQLSSSEILFSRFIPVAWERKREVFLDEHIREYGFLISGQSRNDWNSFTAAYICGVLSVTCYLLLDFSCLECCIKPVTQDNLQACFMIQHFIILYINIFLSKLILLDRQMLLEIGKQLGHNLAISGNEVLEKLVQTALTAVLACRSSHLVIVEWLMLLPVS